MPTKFKHKTTHKMQTLAQPWLPFVLLLFTTLSPPLSASLDRFLKPLHLQRPQQEFIELTHPLPSSDHVAPSCNLTIINHSFANTINKPPFTIPYSPPSDCPQPWSRIILDFHASSKGEQYDRIAGLWLGGTELLRTSTAEPSKSGVFWKIRKDLTRYTSILAQSGQNVTMMLENIVSNVFTGVYHVYVTVSFYKNNLVWVPSILSQHNFDTKLGFDSDEYYDPPAHLIIPISNDDGVGKGFWFRIEKESDLLLKEIVFPRNTFKAVLELYVSFHGNDEFWYSNPPNSYIEMNNLTIGRGNGCFREVFVTIDGKLVAAEAPFPVIFAGGINPLFWEPIVAIGAFSLPSYDMDLTPFLGLVLDGKAHKIGIGVNDAISYWLVNANLHIWLDHSSSKVQARSSVYRYPKLSFGTSEAFKYLDGRFHVAAKRMTVFQGWINSSLGNLSTRAVRQFRFKNSISFDRNGTYKLVQQKVKVKREVEVRNEGKLVTHVRIRRTYPLDVVTLHKPGSRKDRYVLVTNVSHSFSEHCVIGKFRSSISNSQVSVGWMEVKGHSVLSGEGNTQQNYRYRDGSGCYSRNVESKNGKLIRDTTASCISTF